MLSVESKSARQREETVLMKSMSISTASGVFNGYIFVLF